MKKWLMAAVVLMALVCTWAVLEIGRGLDPNALASGNDEALVTSAEEVEVSRAVAMTSTPSSARTSVSGMGPVGALEATGDLALTLVWESDGKPARG
ncbi:MAG: hypothetical protein AAF368_14420, partial [Planctomycetota bacterium]